MSTHEFEPTVTKENGDYVLRSNQRLPGTPEEIFPFFSDPSNLERITPKNLNFRILTPRPIEMREGTVIDYRIKVRGIPLGWRSVITAWEPPFRFVDDQVRGPYRKWVHEHAFVQDGSTTIMKDTARYKVWGGALMNRLIIQRDVMNIFRSRTKILSELFPIT